MSFLYILAGINHFLIPNFYMKIMPSYLPYHLPLVYLSGLIESGLGLLILSKKYQKLAVWGIILLLIAVSPANIYQYTSGQIPLFAFVIRAIIQFLLIWWSYTYTIKSQKDI